MAIRSINDENFTDFTCEMMMRCQARGGKRSGTNKVDADEDGGKKAKG
jgi:hypothetical protein